MLYKAYYCPVRLVIGEYGLKHNTVYIRIYINVTSRDFQASAHYQSIPSHQHWTTRLIFSTGCGLSQGSKSPNIQYSGLRPEFVFSYLLLPRIPTQGRVLQPSLKTFPGACCPFLFLKHPPSSSYIIPQT